MTPDLPNALVGATQPQPSSRAAKPVAARRDASPILATVVRKQVEENDALAERIQAIRSAEAKREWAPTLLAAVSAGIAGTLSFISNLGSGVREMIRHLRHTANRKGEIGNETLRRIWDELDTHEKSIGDIFSIPESERGGAIGEKLQELYVKTKSIDTASLNPSIGRALEKYVTISQKTGEVLNGKLAALANRAPEADSLLKAGGTLDNLGLKDRRRFESYVKDVKVAYERAAGKIANARDEYRKVVEDNVLQQLSREGRHFGFWDLTGSGKRRILLAAATTAVAVGSLVYGLIKFITRESKEDRQIRLALQATKEWEIAQKQPQILAAETSLSRGAEAQTTSGIAAADEAADGKTHLERQKERAARAAAAVHGIS